MTSPFEGKRQTGDNSAPFANMAVGETRVWGDRAITRTDRPFIHDWVDASNDLMRAKGRTDMLWIVDQAGETRLVSAKHHREGLQSWKPAPGEIEAIQRAAAERLRARG